MRIMHVEDEMIVSMAVRSLLEKHGHTVCAQPASGELALEQFSRVKPELVLMDIMLGGEMDGIEAATRIRAQSDVPLVFVSAYGDEETRARAEAASPTAFLIKPLDMRALLRILAEMKASGNGSGES